MTAPAPAARFAGREFYPAEGLLVFGGQRAVLSVREAATLAALVRGGGRLVDKDTLMREVWGDLAVEENNLTQQISRLRRLLGTHPDGQPLIETVPRRGYRLTAPVDLLSPAPAPIAVAGPDAATVPPTPGEPPASRDLGRARHPTGRAALRWAAAGCLVLAIGTWGWWWARAAKGPDRRTLVVLPFQNLTGDPANDYLTEGITDEVTTQLARTAPSALRVIARTSAARFRGSTEGVRVIARNVGADLVLEGSVRRDGGVLRVSARLSDAASETQLWAQSYDQPVEGLLALERTLAQSVATTVRVTVVDPAGAGARDVPRAALEAYRQARYFHTLASVPSIERAIEAYERAIEVDPTFAMAYAGLSRAYVFSTRTLPRTALDRARMLAGEARRLDPELPEAQLAWAMARFYADRDLAGADEEFRLAIAMDAGAADPYFYRAQLLTAAGRFDEALAAARHALALDPFSPLIHHYVGRIHVFARRPQDAIAHLQSTLDLDPNYAWARLFLTVAHEQAGEYDKALDQRQRYWALMGVSPERVAGLRTVYASGGYDAVRRAWIEWIAGFERQRGFVTSTELGLLHAARGETDSAFAALDRAAETGVRDLVYLRVYPELEPLRGDQRFDRLLAKVFPFVTSAALAP
jgi:TolB-like protein/DNA-binding winged helix-turn-helix (wHTH) protein/cytochrome c-type biogenesis protein CcmH/NrfG